MSCESWQQIIRSAYIHIPFCKQKCKYCDFASGPCSSSYEEYIQFLTREIELFFSQRRAAGKPIHSLETIYFGGGTPGLLEPQQLGRILDLLNREVGLAKDAEITYENNPGVGTQQSYKDFFRVGMNRVSLGFQAAQDYHLKRMGRIHSKEDFIQASFWADAAGFQNRSCDLMLGLPEQSLEDLEESLSCVQKLAYPHVSVYALQLEENTPWGEWYNKKEHQKELPSDEEERLQQDRTRNFLSSNGYLAYEISNYSKPGFESRHNQIYWRALPYYGFGSGAHAYVDGNRLGNPWPISKYFTSLYEGSLPSILEERVDREEARKEFFLLGFRLLSGLSLKDYRQRFQEDLPEKFSRCLQDLCLQGLIVQDGDRCCLTHKGEDFANQVFRAFI